MKNWNHLVLTLFSRYIGYTTLVSRYIGATIFFDKISYENSYYDTGVAIYFKSLLEGPVMYGIDIGIHDCQFINTNKALIFFSDNIIKIQSCHFQNDNNTFSGTFIELWKWRIYISVVPISVCCYCTGFILTFSYFEFSLGQNLAIFQSKALLMKELQEILRTCFRFYHLHDHEQGVSYVYSSFIVLCPEWYDILFRSDCSVTGQKMSCRMLSAACLVWKKNIFLGQRRDSFQHEQLYHVSWLSCGWYLF